MRPSYILGLCNCLLLFSCGKGYRQVLTYEDICRYVQVSEDTFELHIEGGFIDSETMGRLFLSRAAELTLQNGGSFFIILRDNRIRDYDGKIGEREAKVDDRMLDRLKVNHTSYLTPLQLELQLSRSNSGTIKICKEVPNDVQFYNAELISKKMLPKAKTETRKVAVETKWPHAIFLVLLILANL